MKTNNVVLAIIIFSIILTLFFKTAYALPIVGQQKMLVIVITPYGSSAINEANNIISLISSFYQESSYGKLALSGDVAGPYGCSDSNSQKYQSYGFVGLVEDNFDLRNYDFVVLYDTCSHPTTEVGTHAITVPTKNGYAYLSVSEANGANSMAAHEFGHALGLLHSTQDTNVMNPSLYQIWHANAIQKEDEGWLDKTQIKTVTQSGRFVLTPFESSSSGLKALRIPLSEDFLYVEYRQPIGYDNQNCLDVFNGATLNKRSSIDDVVTQYVDPSGSSQMCHSVLPGQTYNLGTGTTLKVVSKTAYDLTVDVNIDYTYNSIITHLVSPSMTNDFVAGVIPVEAEAYSPAEISKVEFFYSYYILAPINGSFKFGEAASPPYTASLDTSNIPLTPPKYYGNILNYLHYNPNYWTDAKVWAVITDKQGHTKTTGKATIRVFSPTGFEDQFNRQASTILGNGWSEINGDFTIYQRELKSAGVKGTHLAVQPNLNTPSQRAEADFLLTTVGPSYGIVLRYNDLQNYYYFSRLKTGSMKISKIEKGTEKILATFASKAPFLGSHYHLKAVANGKTLAFNIVGPYGETSEFSVIDSTFSSGAVGIRVDSPDGSYLRINNFFSDKVGQTASNCTHKNPGISISPLEQSANPGESLTYNLNITNRDQGVCLPTSITVAPTLPLDWIQTPPSITEMLSSGQSISSQVTITSASNSIDGPFAIIETASHDDRTIIASQATATFNVLKPANTAPSVIAGHDQTVQKDQLIQLRTIVTDDGLPNPPGQLSELWEQLSGPSQAAFDDVSKPNTTVTFPEIGNYILRLNVDDGELLASDEVGIMVQQGPINFYDDFTRPDSHEIGNNWQIIEGGFAIINNSLKTQSAGNNTLTLSGFVSRDIGVRINLTSPDNRMINSFGIKLRYQDDQNYYYIYKTVRPGRIYISKIIDGKESVLYKRSFGVLVKKKPFILEARNNGNILMAFVNGKNYGKVNDSTFPRGGFAINVDVKNNKWSYILDNIYVTSSPPSPYPLNSITGNLAMKVKYQLSDLWEILT